MCIIFKLNNSTFVHSIQYLIDIFEQYYKNLHIFFFNIKLNFGHKDKIDFKTYRFILTFRFQ